MAQMKAVVYRRYGSIDNLKLEEVAVPTPADDEVLIKIHAVSLNRSDWEGLIGKPLYARVGGLLKPRQHILGSDIAGRVVEVGKNHQIFKPGDAVYGDILGRMGGFAEYVCAKGGVMAIKPDELTFAQAATIPQAGVIALQGIRQKGQVRPGQKVLINGAGGGAGIFAIQLAKMAGAQVTGVDNTGKLEFMQVMGADHVIDYTRANFTKNGENYDLILDLVAYRTAFAYRRALAPNGQYLFVGGSVATLLQVLILGPLLRGSGAKKLGLLAVNPNRKDLENITSLCAEGKIVPQIDKQFSLREVPQALNYLGQNKARGKVVIRIGDGDE